MPKDNPQFQHQNCPLTLGQGLEEFYAVNAHKFSKPEPDTAWTKLLAAHDACHVLFGVNTTVVEEAYGDMWTLFGTTMTFKEYSEYAKSDAGKALLREIGLKKIIIGSLKALPGCFKIFLKARKMSKKWSLWKFEDRLNDKLIDLRKEFNLEILGA